MGACGAIRRDIFLEMGGFDERYRQPCIEDIELGYRLKKAGYRLRLEKELQVKHLKRWETLSILKTDFFQRALPWTELILRDGHAVNDLNLKLSSRMSVMLIFSIIGLLVLSRWQREASVVAGAFGLALLALNAPLYRFFIQKRGFRFMLCVLPWHWLYFFYSGLALAIGVARHIFKRAVVTQHLYCALYFLNINVELRDTCSKCVVSIRSANSSSN